MIDHEALKMLPLMEEKQQHMLFDEIMRQIGNMSDNDFLSCMTSLGIYCIKLILPEETELITKHLVNYIKEKRKYVSQIVEFCGFIIKYLDNKYQDRILAAVNDISESLMQSTSGIIALTKLLRESGKILTDDQIAFYISLLNNLKQKVPEYLFDTISYSIDHINNQFISSKADVLLLIPEFLSGSSFLQPPICMIQSKSDLINRGLSVDIFDNRVYHYPIKDLVRIIGNHYKYIVVTSSPIDQYQAYFVDKRFVVFSDTVNAIQCGCKYDQLIVCGSHGTTDYKMLLNDVSPDLIVLGNYESRLGHLIENLRNKTDLNHIYGIVYKNGDCYYQSIATYSDAILDWENNIIDYSLIDLNDYYGYEYVNNLHVLKRKWAILQATQGCPYHCLFCYNIYGEKVKYKTITNVIKELKQLEILGCKEVFFIDQTFTINQKYTENLCESIIKNNIKIKWQCETRVDCIKESTLVLMKKAGCTSIWIGIESFDKKVLELNEKNYRHEQLIKLIDLLKHYDMDYSAFIMYGMFGENIDSLHRTVNAIINNRIKTSRSIIQCIPRPGTQLYLKVDASVRKRVSHFWQIDSLRNRFNDTLAQMEIDAAISKLMKSHTDNLISN